MREYKFRSWDKENKRMRSHEDLLRMTKECFSQVISPDIILIPITQPHIELMQYTGLKDWGGNEIYEGDILEYTSSFGGQSRTMNLLVSWSEVDGAFLFGSIRTDYAIRSSRVIGNIYENPGLIS